MVDCSRERIGLYVRRLREERGWTQRELAVRVGIHQSMVSRIELAETDVGVQQLRAIVAALGYELHMFIALCD